MELFTHQRITMAVQRFGAGPAPLLAFHGFGRTGHDFAPLAPPLASQATIHAFDLPFHGQSPGPEGGAPITPAEWAACIRAYAGHIGAHQVGLLGYSLGGRLALGLVAQCAPMLSHVFLLAPDGLVQRPWYRSLAHHAWGRALYKAIIRHPGPVHGLLRLLHACGLLDARMFRFMMEQTGSVRARTLVHAVWTSLRLIEPSLARVAQQALAARLPVHVFLGEHDRVIRPAQGRKLERLAPGLVQLHVLPTGHRMLDRSLGEALAAWLP